ncbi:MAG: hypothetical protein JRH16_05450 [Deltaproteobacteria bacterium]|nr:hypothetical protein [Deltaproteobacteria bacterium]MBW2359539.1 hypothetical protein [Deltaproteobacteria bacterium]
MLRFLSVLCLAAALVGCDRNVEPYVEGEQPRQPDLSAIFPEGAERAAAGDVRLPEPPQLGGRGADPSSEASPIRGVIRVADGLQERVGSGGVLFLMARSGSDGPPLAVQRIAQPGFPLEFALGPEHRMIQTLPFAGELRLTARLDSDGDAGSRTPGDLQGKAAGVHAPGATGVEIVLDEML